MQGAYTAMGTGGTFITVLPNRDMVVVHQVDIDKNTARVSLAVELHRDAVDDREFLLRRRLQVTAACNRYFRGRSRKGTSVAKSGSLMSFYPIFHTDRRILNRMVRMTVLASGSQGNSTVVSTARTRILVDAGFPAANFSSACRLGR